MKLLIFSAILALVSFGCRKTENGKNYSNSIPGISDEEHRYVLKYGAFRRKVTDVCDLPENAPIEALRPHFSKFLKLQDDASWEDMLRTPFVKALCTEEKRKKFVSIFHLPSEATWITLGLRVEELWQRLAQPR